MRKSCLCILALGLAFGGTPIVVQADTLLVERVARSKATVLPRQNTAMSEVEAQYGAPKEKKAAVGTPPISRWIYPAFTVYFEGDRVINAVVNKSSELEQGPRPAPAQKKPAP